jgi:hypothetical protein
MGWFVDTYNGCERLSHGGYFYDVNSEVMLFPKAGVGIVSFTNFGPPALARLIGERAFDLLKGLQPVQTVEEKLAQYEKRREEVRQRNPDAPRVENTSASHSPGDYCGIYRHVGYGQIEIQRDGDELTFRRGGLHLPLQRWHYDMWVAQDAECFWSYGAFDAKSPLLFETDAGGQISAVTIPLEAAVAPIRFVKQT